MNEHEALEMSAQGPPKPRGDRGLLPPKRRICYGLGSVKATECQAPRILDPFAPVKLTPSGLTILPDLSRR